MGQKTNPIGYRIGVNKQTESIWFATKEEYIQSFHEDLMIRKYLKNRLPDAQLSRIEISRKTRSITLDINTGRPGHVIGRKGAEIDKLRSEITVMVNKNRDAEMKIFINVLEIKNPWTDAALVGEEIGRQIKNRVTFRRAMKFAIRNAMRNGAQGIKLQVSGRLGGADMARTERYKEGRTPLHTLRADIDYALTEITTTYGVIGIKVWVYKGDILS
ncbi:MAG: 30S ribosomal protein S3 [Candidatus Cloacimonetes bacterium]|nr:30S ribosomal protein S3 [Candidatus Cloacimonadota bacterium]